MKPSLAFFCGFIAAVVPLGAQQGPVGEGPEIFTYPTGEKLIHWHGQPGRTYFMQVSSQAEPLAGWTWAPYIEIGDGETISHEIEGDTAKAFFRLVHTDLPLPPGVTLEDWDIDGDGRSNHEEITGYYPSHPLLADTDGDGLDDGWEALHGLNLLADDTLLDPDGDGIGNAIELTLRLHPTNPDSDADGISDGDEDTDRDGLSNLEEINLHGTEPGKWDTDEDGMPDGWEVGFLLDATAGAGANGANGTNGDPDGDDLSNFEEWLNGTAPDNPNSDGDAQNDGVEVAQGSNPKNAADNGEPPPAKDLVGVPFTVSDPSVSESEKWKMTIVGKGPDDTRTMGLASVEFGEPTTKTLKLRKWNRYEVTVEHLATDPEPPVNGETDYDWEATVDGLPLGESHEKTESTPGVNNFCVAGKYWQVDNREAVFTTEKHGDDENIVAGKKAVLVPVEIGDTLVATGVDDVSVTANEDAIGYKEDFWIMAPMGGQQYSDDMYFKIPVNPATPLDFTCENATPDPATISLDLTSWQTKQPVVTWRGSGTDTTDNVPVFLVGEDDNLVDLPIRVKSMKKRTVNVAVYPVQFDDGNRAVPLPDQALLTQRLNEVFGYQVNAWMNVTYKPTTVFDYEDDFVIDGDIPFNDYAIAASPKVGAMMTDAAYVDATQDIRVFLIDSVEFRIAHPDDLNRLNGIAFPDENLVIINAGYPLGNRPDPEPEALLSTFAHELGHVITQSGHPDEEAGVAPLSGTDRTQRIMCSGPVGAPTKRAPGAKLLVKAEWDSAEAWLSSNSDARYRLQHSLGANAPTGNY